jgi:hypothetical protein
MAVFSLFDTLDETVSWAKQIGADLLLKINSGALEEIML